MNNWLCEPLAFHSGGKKTAEEVDSDIMRAKIITAQGGKDYGLVDEVLVSRKAQPQA